MSFIKGENGIQDKGRNMWKRAYKIISMQKKTTQKVHDCIIAFMHSCELYISMHLCEIMHMHVDVQNIK